MCRGLSHNQWVCYSEFWLVIGMVTFCLEASALGGKTLVTALREGGENCLQFDQGMCLA